MPIRPQYKWLYPIDWPQLSAMIRFERAKSRCEEYGRPHGRGIQHLGDGRWWDDEDQIWRNGRGRSSPRPAVVNDTIAVRTTKVVLATRRWITLRMRKAIGDLFLGLYRT